MRETQGSIGEWAVETFGGESGLTARHCIRLMEEVVELCLAAGASAHSIDLAVGKSLERAGCCRDWDLWCWEDVSHPLPEKVPEELADCGIVLDTLAHRAGVDLQSEKDKKMEVNRHHRKWECKGDGTGYHAKGEC